MQIGHRYLLPVYPLAVLLAVDGLRRLPGSRRRTMLAALLVAGQGFSAQGAFPHYLAYFSPLVGGSARGHLWLSDSNLDWGQDLWLLDRAWRGVDHDRRRLWYFGTAEPRAYGLSVPRLTHGDLTEDAPWERVAISVTLLQGVYADEPGVVASVLDRKTCVRLLHRVPAERIGYSIWVFTKNDVLDAMNDHRPTSATISNGGMSPSSRQSDDKEPKP